eukprot:6505916-Prorocentrum_lima.AAC.1
MGVEDGGGIFGRWRGACPAITCRGRPAWPPDGMGHCSASAQCGRRHGQAGSGQAYRHTHTQKVKEVA